VPLSSPVAAFNVSHEGSFCTENVYDPLPPLTVAVKLYDAPTVTLVDGVPEMLRLLDELLEEPDPEEDDEGEEVVKTLWVPLYPKQPVRNDKTSTIKHVLNKFRTDPPTLFPTSKVDIDK